MSDNNMMFATEDDMLDMDSSGTPEIPMDKYLTFYADQLLLGVSAEYVVEIITNYTITKLPMVPEYVRGIVNLRGLIIPIIDTRLRLNKMPQDSICIIVLNIEGTQIGIMIDAVAQMIDIPTASLLPMPAHNTQKLVCGMCSIPNGKETMLVLDCHLLLLDE